MWLTRTLIIIFIVIVSLVLHDIRQILQLQSDLMKEQYIMRGQMNVIMDMTLNSTNATHPEMYKESQKKDETTTVEVEL
jgi:hypothetical protein